MYAWEGLSHGNVSRPSNHSTDMYMDFDTNCDDDEDLFLYLFIMI